MATVAGLRPTELRARLRARWNTRELTLELAAGAHPHMTPELRIRAALLTSARGRRAIARGLDGVVAAAVDPPWHLTGGVPFDARAVLGARATLERLAAELRSARRVDPQGVALAELLLTDHDGPLYSGHDLRGLPGAARAALAALG